MRGNSEFAKWKTRPWSYRTGVPENRGNSEEKERISSCGPAQHRVARNRRDHRRARAGKIQREKVGPGLRRLRQSGVYAGGYGGRGFPAACPDRDRRGRFKAQCRVARNLPMGPGTDIRNFLSLRGNGEVCLQRVACRK